MMQTRYLYHLKQHQHFGTLGALTDVLKDRQKEKDKNSEKNFNHNNKKNEQNTQNSNNANK